MTPRSYTHSPLFTAARAKPRALMLGKPKHDGGETERNLEYFDVDILEARDRADLLAQLPAFVAAHGPYQAVIARLSPAAYEPFDAALLAPLLPHLRIVVSAQAGYNDFDVAWMTRHGVWFCNSPHATADATADMALFLVLAVLRNASLAEAGLRAGAWRAALPLARDPAGLTLGIVGLGAVGERLARKAAGALGMRVAYWSRSGPRRGAAAAAGYKYCATLDELLRCADVVSLHCALTPATQRLLSRRELALMRPGSFLVNTARGGLVDDAALVAALEAGRIARAGLDVFDGEPGAIHPYYLQRPDKVVVQPHMGGLTEASFAKAAAACFANLRALFCEPARRPLAPVNEVVVVRVHDEEEEEEEEEEMTTGGLAAAMATGLSGKYLQVRVPDGQQFGRELEAVTSPRALTTF